MMTWARTVSIRMDEIIPGRGQRDEEGIRC